MVHHPVRKIAGLVEPLTRREKEILERLTTDRSNAEIAEDLSLALSSVKWYAQQIYSKLGVENRRQAVSRARELGILEGPGAAAGHAPVGPSGAVNFFDILPVANVLPLANVLPRGAEVAPHHNLPVQLTSFIGRDNELTSLQDLILTRQAGLVTLTGSGGTGKTRLALRAAERLLEQFPQGIWLVELAPVSDPALVLRAVAEVLGVREDPQRNLLQVLKAFLRDRQMLLILDNCEHLVSEAAALAAALLHACPRLSILATSREILGVEGEIPFRCPSLDGDAALRLFVERARTTTPGFTLTGTNAPVIARICQRLDGIPLAIELAAARTRMLSPEQIAARLDQAFRLLTGGSRSVLPRHQTLKALIDWSFNLLSAEELVLLMRLSVFAGGWTLDAAEAVCADDEVVAGQVKASLRPEQILDLLGQLLDKSLIQVEQDQAGEPRYRMLETVRQYARERYVSESQVEDRGVDTLYERHLDYFQALALQAESNLRSSEARRWLDGLECEMDNFRQALEWSLAGSVEKGLRLAAALLWFWHMRNHRTEGAEWLKRLLEAEKLRSSVRPRQRGDWIARGKGLNTLSELSGRMMHANRHEQQARGEESRDIFQMLGEGFQRDYAHSLFTMATTTKAYLDCRRLFQQAGDLFYTAECNLELSSSSLEENNLDQMLQYAQENLAMREALGDIDGEGFALFLLAMWELFRGSKRKASEYSRRSVRCFEIVGNREMIAFPLSIPSLIALAQGNYEQAAAHVAIERALGQEVGNPAILVEALSMDGLVAWARKEYERAVQYAREALELARDLTVVWRKPANYVLGRVAISQGNFSQARVYLAELLPKTRASAMYPNDLRTLHVLVILAAGQQQMLQAATLIGAQDALYGGWANNLLSPAEQNEYNLASAAARAALGEEAFTAAWNVGRSMTKEQAQEYSAGLSF